MSCKFCLGKKSRTLVFSLLWCSYHRNAFQCSPHQTSSICCMETNTKQMRINISRDSKADWGKEKLHSKKKKKEKKKEKGKAFRDALIGSCWHAKVVGVPISWWAGTWKTFQASSLVLGWRASTVRSAWKWDASDITQTLAGGGGFAGTWPLQSLCCPDTGYRWRRLTPLLGPVQGQCIWFCLGQWFLNLCPCLKLWGTLKNDNQLQARQIRISQDGSGSSANIS